MNQIAQIKRAWEVRDLNNPTVAEAIIMGAETASPQVKLHAINGASLTKEEATLLPIELLRLHKVCHGQPYNVFMVDRGYAIETDWTTRWPDGSYGPTTKPTLKS